MRYSYLCALMALMALPAGATENVRVSLITIYPGSEVYELYGHSELRVVEEPDAAISEAMPQRGESDLYFNYGLFDFNAPNFVYRFVKGETDYLCGAIPAHVALRGYDGRRVVEQVLNLTPTQAAAVRNALYSNALPENATYRYKFVSNNCATRPRDIVEAALGGKLRYRAGDSVVTTYREMMHRYNGNYAWSRFGIDLALGAPLDTAISYRQQMFVPMVLMDAFSHATVDGEPLVKETRVLVEGPEEGKVENATPLWQTPLAVSVLLLLITIYFTQRDVYRHRVNRWFDTVLFSLCGVWGGVLFFLIFVSTHEATSPNFNALWLNPLMIALAVMVWVKKWEKWLGVLHAVNAVAILGAVAVYVTGLQHADMAFYPLMAMPLARSISYLLVLRHNAKASK